MTTRITREEALSLLQIPPDNRLSFRYFPIRGESGKCPRNSKKPFQAKALPKLSYSFPPFLLLFDSDFIGTLYHTLREWKRPYRFR